MTENYQQLLGLKNNYEDKQIDVLNIYGDIKMVRTLMVAYLTVLQSH